MQPARNPYIIQVQRGTSDRYSRLAASQQSRARSCGALPDYRCAGAQSEESDAVGVWMDLSGNQTNALYAQLEPYVDNSSGAVSRRLPFHSPVSQASCKS